VALEEHSLLVQEVYC